MLRRLAAAVLTLAALVNLCGCWNYRGLDQLSIVVGIAVDYDKNERLYRVSYEVVDLSGTNKEAAIQSKIITSSGETMFEAARNAKKKEADKLFFGSAQVLILSLELVKEIGVLQVIEWFLRDAECRESMCVAVSQEETAEEILITSEKMSGMMSSILREIIMEDNEVTATAPHVELFRIYNELNTPVHCVAIPALRRVKQNGSDITELNGSAIVHHDKFMGMLPPDLGKYLLILYNESKGGLLTVTMPDKPEEIVTLEVFEQMSKTDFERNGDQLTFNIKTITFVATMENNASINTVDRSDVAYLEDVAARHVEAKIRELVAKAQHEYKTDIVKFGELIYKRDYKYWSEIGDRWDEIFPTVQVNVSSKVLIRNVGFIK
jgi:spore germination protein KC